MSNEFFKEWSGKFTPLLMRDFGFSALDAAAIMGNAGAESNGFQSLQELKPVVSGSRGGYGIMQWTGPRRRAYEAYCARNGLNPSDMMSNYKYLFVELKGDEKASVEKIKTGKSLEQKTEIFMKSFLRPGIPHLDSRIRWARIARDSYSGTSETSTSSLDHPDVVPTPSPTSLPQPKSTGLLGILIAILQALFGRRS